MKTQLKNIAIAVITFLLLCSAASADIGLGIAPASVNIADALKGGSYERMISVFNTGDEAGTFMLTTEGECSEWISFYAEVDQGTELEEVTIPAGDKAKILVRFQIPEDIANADYTATIYAQTIPKFLTGTEGAAAQAVIRIPSKITIGVTGTQILGGTVKSITISDTEIDYPLKIKVFFQNEGNVVAKPKIAVEITKDREIVDSFIHDKTGIKPDSEGMITVLRNTTGLEDGDYIAKVTVTLGDEVLTTKDLPFKILPFGTLTRQGELTSLIIEGDPQAGRMTKILAEFENTGKIDCMAAFRGEVYLNNEFVDTVASDEMSVEVGKTTQLTAYYKVPSSGGYVVKGYVFYEGKDTNIKEVSFDCGSAKSGSGLFSIPGFSGLVLIIVMIYLAKRRLKE